MEQSTSTDADSFSANPVISKLYGTQKFIYEFRRHNHWSYNGRVESISPHPDCSIKIYYGTTWLNLRGHYFLVRIILSSEDRCRKFVRKIQCRVIFILEDFNAI
jgi:hypothetical protein